MNVFYKASRLVGFVCFAFAIFLLPFKIALGNEHPIVIGPIPGIALSTMMENGFFAENLAYNKSLLSNRSDFPKMMLGGKLHIACLESTRIREFLPTLHSFHLNSVIAFDKNVMLTLSFRQLAEDVFLKLGKMAFVINLNDTYRNGTRIGKIILPFNTYLAIGKFNPPFGKFYISETVDLYKETKMFKEIFYSGILIGFDKDIGIYNVKGTYFVDQKKWGNVNGHINVTVYQPNFDIVFGGSYSQTNIFWRQYYDANLKSRLEPYSGWDAHIGFIKHNLTVKATSVVPFKYSIPIYLQLEVIRDIPRIVSIPGQIIAGISKKYRERTKAISESQKLWIFVKYKAFNHTDLHSGVLFEPLRQGNNKSTYRKTYHLQLRCFF